MRTVALLLCLLPCLSRAIDAPVVDIVATTDGDSVYVTLAWDTVPGAARYQVYRQDQFLGTSTLLSDNATSPFLTAVPTGWNWQTQPDVLKYFKVVASDAPLHPVPMIRVPAGTFMMGQNGIEIPEHEITLTNEFMLSNTEVTNAQFLEALNWANESHLITITGDYVYQYGEWIIRINRTDYDLQEIRYDNINQRFFLHAGTYSYNDTNGPGFAFPYGYDPSFHPVKFVTWYGAACYCDWLSQMEGLIPFYNGNWNQSSTLSNPYIATGYRLPTEAEWEYAAQYPDDRTYTWGNIEPNCDLANYSYCTGWTNTSGSQHSGASYLGFQDMMGNVLEWCNDWYEPYSNSPLTNPVGPDEGTARIVRGGGWAYDVTMMLIARRGFIIPYAEGDGIGFRICRTAQ